MGHLVQPSCRSRATYSSLHRTLSRRVLNISREGDSTTSLGSLFQCSVTLRRRVLPTSPNCASFSTNSINTAYIDTAKQSLQTAWTDSQIPDISPNSPDKQVQMHSPKPECNLILLPAILAIPLPGWGDGRTETAVSQPCLSNSLLSGFQHLPPASVQLLSSTESSPSSKKPMSLCPTAYQSH